MGICSMMKMLLVLLAITALYGAAAVNPANSASCEAELKASWPADCEIFIAAVNDTLAAQTFNPICTATQGANIDKCTAGPYSQGCTSTLLGSSMLSGRRRAGCAAPSIEGNKTQTKIINHVKYSVQTLMAKALQNMNLYIREANRHSYTNGKSSNRYNSNANKPSVENATPYYYSPVSEGKCSSSNNITTTLKVMTALNSSPDVIIAGRTFEDWAEFVVANKPGE